MGFFTPKISKSEMMYVNTTLKQLQDSVRLVNTTLKPDVFFKRLNFTLDLLLRLQPYEKYKIFNSGLPSSDYARIISNLGATVDDFISRALAANQAKISSLKTEKAKKENRIKFATALISAFDCAHTFWSGDYHSPHYTGPLFTEQNYRRVQAIWDATCDDV